MDAPEPEGKGAAARQGSGYLFRPGLILTAAHVLVPPGETRKARPGDCCQVLPWADLDRAVADEAWLDGVVVACDGTGQLDLAVVSVPGLDAGVAPVRWGRLVGDDEIDWEAVGFPRAGLDARGRKPDHARGTVSPIDDAPNGLGLTVTSRVARKTRRGTSGWAGLSGAAVFAGQRLVGVVLDDPGMRDAGYDHALGGVRIAAAVDMAEDSVELLDALGHPRLEPVTPSPEERRRRALEDFLEAQRDEAENLPYEAIRTLAERGGREVPRVTEVYVEQQQEEHRPERPKPRSGRHTETTKPAPALAVRRTVTDALQRHRHLVVEGGAGIGKSTLLHHLATWASDGRATPTDPSDSAAAALAGVAVPVRVPARRLAGSEESFAATLRTAATRELSTQAGFTLPEDLFEHPPAPGKTWLVLIDALDEVMEGKAREQLVKSLHNAARRRPPLYRLVVTTRPAPDLHTFEPTLFAHYRLRPFDQDQMEQFVRRWFTARSGAPGTDAEQFLRQVNDSRIHNLAGTPLLLTMAALLSEEPRDDQAPGGTSGNGLRPELPPSRAELYQRFVAMLLREDASRATRASFVGVWDREHGRDGFDYADALFNQRGSLLTRLAVWQTDEQLLAADGSFASDHATVLLAPGRPRKVPNGVEHDWLAGQIEALLRRTGVVVHQAEELQFIHETFREYFLATQHTDSAGDDDRDDAVPLADQPRVRDLLGQWHHPAMREIVLFTIALCSLDATARNGAGRSRADATVLLRQIWSPPSPRPNENLLMAASALAEGIRADNRYEAAVVAALVEMAVDPRTYGDDALSTLGRLRRLTELQRIAAEAPRDYIRVSAARVLLDLGELDLGQAALVSLAREAQMETALGVVTTIFDRRHLLDAESLLWALLSDHTMSALTRISAAATLGRMAPGNDADLVEQLSQLTDDPAVDALYRVGAARLAAGLQPGETEEDPSTDPSAEQTTEPSPTVMEEYELVDLVGQTWGHHRLDDTDVVVAALRGIVETDTVAGSRRASAAGALVALGHADPRIGDAMRTVVADAGTDADATLDATAVLLTLDHTDQDIAGTLRGLAATCRTPTLRLRAADQLHALGHVDTAVAIRRSIARSRRAPTSTRLGAAIALAESGDVGPLRRLATSRWRRARNRYRAAFALVRHDDAGVLTRIALGHRLSSHYRTDAADELHKRGHPDAGDAVLRALATDSHWSVQADHRLQAAASLAERGDVETLVRIATDRESASAERLDAATELDRLGHAAAADAARRALATDTHRDVHAVHRVQAATNLAVRGDAEPLQQLAGDHDFAAQAHAAQRLAQLGHRDVALACLQRAVDEETTSSYRRTAAALALADLGEADPLQRLAEDPAVEARHRMDIAAHLIDAHGDQVRAVAVYRAVADDDDADGMMRVDAIRRLGELDQHAAFVAACDRLARSPAAGDIWRQRAVQHLAGADLSPETDSVLLALTVDDTVPPDTRVSAAGAVARKGHAPKAIPVLHEIVADADLGLAVRTDAVRSLISIGRLRDLVTVVTTPQRGLAVRGRMHARAMESLAARARGAGIGGRRASDALLAAKNALRRPSRRPSWLGQPTRRSRRPRGSRTAGVTLWLLRLVVTGALCLGATAGTAVALSRLADSRAWLVLPGARPAVVTVWALALTVAYMRVAYRRDELLGSRPFPWLAVRALLPTSRRSAGRRSDRAVLVVNATPHPVWTLAWLIGTVAAWVVNALAASALAWLGLPTAVTFFVPLLLALVLLLAVSAAIGIWIGNESDDSELTPRLLLDEAGTEGDVQLMAGPG